MSEHAWCRDVQRDEAVRAAEDGRQGPFLTLGEAIATPFTKKATICESESAVEAVIPAADAHGGGGHSLRTERVTLEVTHDLDAPLGDWIVQVVDESLGLAETVRVVEEPAPAASGAATEPVAWGVVARGIVLATSTSRSDAVDMQSEHAIDTVVVPLYTAPPPARGWLTEEERKAISMCIEDCNQGDDEESEWLCEQLESLLARSSPPEVVLPVSTIGRGERYDGDWVEGWIACRERCAAALAAAGVTVKEVGR